MLIVALCLAAFLRNALWQDDMTIWADSLEKSPLKARGYNELGIHYVSTREYDKAYAVLQRSLELNKYQPEIYINLGLVYEGLKRIDLAVQAYRNAVSYAPQDPIPYYNLGVIYYTNYKDLDAALVLFQKARDLNPLEPDVHQYLGNIYRDKGDLQKANEEYQLNRSLK